MDLPGFAVFSTEATKSVFQLVEVNNSSTNARFPGVLSPSSSFHAMVQDTGGEVAFCNAMVDLMNSSSTPPELKQQTCNTVQHIGILSRAIATNVMRRSRVERAETVASLAHHVALLRSQGSPNDNHEVTIMLTRFALFFAQLFRDSSSSPSRSTTSTTTAAAAAAKTSAALAKMEETVTAIAESLNAEHGSTLCELWMALLKAPVPTLLQAWTLVCECVAGMVFYSPSFASKVGSKTHIADLCRHLVATCFEANTQPLDDDVFRPELLANGLFLLATLCHKVPGFSSRLLEEVSGQSTKFWVLLTAILVEQGKLSAVASKGKSKPVDEKVELLSIATRNILTALTCMAKANPSSFAKLVVSPHFRPIRQSLISAMSPLMVNLSHSAPRLVVLAAMEAYSWLLQAANPPSFSLYCAYQSKDDAARIISEFSNVFIKAGEYSYVENLLRWTFSVERSCRERTTCLRLVNALVSVNEAFLIECADFLGDILTALAFVITTPTAEESSAPSPSSPSFVRGGFVRSLIDRDTVETSERGREDYEESEQEAKELALKIMTSLTKHRPVFCRRLSDDPFRDFRRNLLRMLRPEESAFTRALAADAIGQFGMHSPGFALAILQENETAVKTNLRSLILDSGNSFGLQVHAAAAFGIASLSFRATGFASSFLGNNKDTISAIARRLLTLLDSSSSSSIVLKAAGLTAITRITAAHSIFAHHLTVARPTLRSELSQIQQTFKESIKEIAVLAGVAVHTLDTANTMKARWGIEEETKGGGAAAEGGGAAAAGGVDNSDSGNKAKGEKKKDSGFSFKFPSSSAAAAKKAAAATPEAAKEAKSEAAATKAEEAEEEEKGQESTSEGYQFRASGSSYSFTPASKEEIKPKSEGTGEKETAPPPPPPSSAKKPAKPYAPPKNKHQHQHQQKANAKQKEQEKKEQEKREQEKREQQQREQQQREQEQRRKEFEQRQKQKQQHQQQQQHHQQHSQQQQQQQYYYSSDYHREENSEDSSSEFSRWFAKLMLHAHQQSSRNESFSNYDFYFFCLFIIVFVYYLGKWPSDPLSSLPSLPSLPSIPSLPSLKLPFFWNFE